MRSRLLGRGRRSCKGIVERNGLRGAETGLDTCFNAFHSGCKRFFEIAGILQQVLDIDISNIGNDMRLDDIHPRVAALALEVRERNEHDFAVHHDKKAAARHTGRLAVLGGLLDQPLTLFR